MQARSPRPVIHHNRHNIHQHLITTPGRDKSRTRKELSIWRLYELKSPWLRGWNKREGIPTSGIWIIRLVSNMKRSSMIWRRAKPSTAMRSTSLCPSPLTTRPCRINTSLTDQRQHWMKTLGTVKTYEERWPLIQSLAKHAILINTDRERFIIKIVYNTY